MDGDSRLTAIRDRLRSCRSMLVERHGDTPAGQSVPKPPSHHSAATASSLTTKSSLTSSTGTNSTYSSSSSSSSCDEVPEAPQQRRTIFTMNSSSSGSLSRAGAAGGGIAGRAGMRRGVQTGKQIWETCCNNVIQQGLPDAEDRLEVGEEAAGAVCVDAARWHQREQHRSRMGLLSNDEGSVFITLLRNAPVDSPDRLLLEVVEEIEEAVANLRLPPPPVKGGSHDDTASVNDSHVRSIPIFDKLMDFQKEGVAWLYSLWQDGWNTILADEMGLGKTVQTIALLSAQRLTSKPKRRSAASSGDGPVLIVAPLSTLSNWESEFGKFDPSQRVAMLVGDPAARDVVAKRVLDGEVDVLLMQFDSLARKLAKNTPVAKLRGIQWSMLVIDEAHRIKNAESTLYGALEGMYFKSKMVLTGTPLQNSVRELLSLIRFMVPLERKKTSASRLRSKNSTSKLFGSLADVVDSILRQTATVAKEEAQLFQNEQLRIYVCRRLHRLIEPFLLRRERDDVLNNMPEKDEHILVCPLSAHQRGLLATMEERRKVGLFTGCTAIDFRKVLLHPYLVDRTSYFISEKVIYSSGKFYALDLLTRFLWATGNHKFLIFCSWTKVLDLVESMNIERDLPYVRLCGNVSGEDRTARIHQYNTTSCSDLPCFLISKIAGGVGLNLQSADTVIMLDEDYNPQRDLQALSRVYRVGQSKHVKVFRLAIQHEQEERITAIAKDKEMLAKAVMSAGMYNLKATDQDREDALSSLIVSSPTSATAPPLLSSPASTLPTTTAADIQGCSQFTAKEATALHEDLLKCVPRGQEEYIQLCEFLQVEGKRKRTTTLHADDV